MPSQKSMIVQALLNGETLSIMTAFKMFGSTNLPRELGRSVIHPVTGFNAKILKRQVDFTSRYGHSGYYFEYQLEVSERNKEAIDRMKEYLKTKK